MYLASLRIRKVYRYTVIHKVHRSPQAAFRFLDFGHENAKNSSRHNADSFLLPLPQKIGDDTSKVNPQSTPSQSDPTTAPAEELTNRIYTLIANGTFVDAMENGLYDQKKVIVIDKKIVVWIRGIDISGDLKFRILDEDLKF